jgi:hypothetical protein
MMSKRLNYWWWETLDGMDIYIQYWMITIIICNPLHMNVHKRGDKYHLFYKFIKPLTILIEHDDYGNIRF